MTVNGASQQGYMQNPDFRQVIYQALFPLGQYSVLRPQALALEILVETEVYSDMLRQGVTVLEYNVHFFLYCIGEYILFCPDQTMSLTTNLARPKTSAIITVRVIKSLEFRTERSLVLRDINLETTTIGNLKTIMRDGDSPTTCTTRAHSPTLCPALLSK